MSPVKVTVMRSKTTKRVIYVEAGKDFIDLLLSFLILPIGTVMARLCGQSDVVTSFGAISSIFNSMGELATHHLKVPAGSLSNPTVSLQSRQCAEEPAKNLLGIQVVSQPDAVETFYTCSSIGSLTAPGMFSFGPCSFISKTLLKTCPLCKQDSSLQPFTVPKDVSSSGSGLVVEYPYIVTDDLQIAPASAGKAFDLLRNNVVSMDEVENDVVEVSPHQALRLLAASFTSGTVLNDVFFEQEQAEVEARNS